MGTLQIALRDDEGAVATCAEPDPYEAVKHNGHCDVCKLRQSQCMDALKSIGITPPGSDYNESISTGLGKTKRFRRYNNV